MSSYESLVGRALLTSDPAERQMAEDCITVKMAAQKFMFCPFTGALLDQSKTVVLETANDGTAVMHADAWEAAKDGPRVIALIEAGARVLDGRILFARKSRKPVAK